MGLSNTDPITEYNVSNLFSLFDTLIRIKVVFELPKRFHHLINMQSSVCKIRVRNEKSFSLNTRILHMENSLCKSNGET